MGNLSNLLVFLDLLLLFFGFYFLIFKSSVWGSLVGLVFTLASFLIPERLDKESGQIVKTHKYEIVFLMGWFLAYLILNIIWVDAYLARPYFNMVLFVYFAYRLYRIIKSS